MSSRDKELVTLKCQDCGDPYQITYGWYRKLNKWSHHRCNKCYKIWMSTRFDNLTESERSKLKDQRSKSAKRTWEQLSSDEYLRRCASQKARWEKLSKEEKEKVMEKTRIAQIEYANDPKTKEALAKRNHDRWVNMSPDERKAEMERLALIRDNYWNSLSTAEQYLKMAKMWNANLSTTGPTEFEFNDTLHEIGLCNGVEYYWGYNTYPYVNPEYFNTFGKKNQVTGEDNIPYHSWDFILFPASKTPVLIDIDGSAHNPKYMHFRRKGNEYTERQKIDYNDSQRVYQVPAGAVALIVRAWNDELLPDTPVVSVFHQHPESSATYSSMLEVITNRFQLLHGAIGS